MEDPMDLLDTLKKYGHNSLGYPSESTVERMQKQSPELFENLETMLITPIKSIKAPLYHEKQEDGLWLPIPEEYVPYLQAMIGNRYSKAYSVSEAVVKLEALGFHVSSRGQVSNIWNRQETKLQLKDKTRHAVKASAERVAEAKKEGKACRKPYTDARKKQLASARKIRSEKLLIERLEKEQSLAKKRLANEAYKTGKSAKDIKLSPVVKAMREGSIKETKDSLAEAKRKVLETGKKVLYEPTPKQAEFHAADEDILLYGGAAGGGKSYAMLVDALRYCQHEDYRALIIRRTSPMLKELIGVSRTLYPKAFPGAKYNKSENVWYFPSGATIQFGYLDKPEDLENYQGLPYAYIGFDEIQHQRSDEGFVYLMSRLRSANPAIKCYIRASANPGGAPWVKETFIDPAEPNTTFMKNGISYRFIPANLSDNPYLDTPVGDDTISPYRKMLMALPEVKRKQLLDGDWFAGEDAMFAFTPFVHVTNELPPLHWNVINGLDYGYTDPAASLWAAICPNTGRMIIYQELECIGFTHSNWGKEVMTSEGYLPQGVDRIIDHSVFNNTGHVGPGVRELLSKLGIHPRPADRNREAGWNQLHERFIVDPLTGLPNLMVHSSCAKLIDQILSARRNDKKPDDIDDKRIKTKGRTHHWDLLDTLRYICMSRPQRLTIQERAMSHKTAAQGFEKSYGYFK
jgi:hypothetical protein